MNKQSAIEKAKREWIKSGAYRTISFMVQILANWGK